MDAQTFFSQPVDVRNQMMTAGGARGFVDVCAKVCRDIPQPVLARFAASVDWRAMARGIARGERQDLMLVALTTVVLTPSMRREFFALAGCAL
jgi:hypothetical protein